MRIPLTIGLAAAAGLAACNKPAPTSGGVAVAASSAPPAAAAPGPLSPQDLPHPKAGLWRQTMAIEGLDKAPPSTETCLDAASEAKMSMFGQNIRQNHCEAGQISRNLNGSISSSSTCSFGPGGKTVTKATMTGDFNSGYKMVIHSTPKAGPERVVIITATYLGPCAPGQKGGDVILPGGRTINMTQ